MNNNKALAIFAKNNVIISDNGIGLTWPCGTCGKMVSWNPNIQPISWNYIDNDSMADLFEALSWFLRNPEPQRE